MIILIHYMKKLRHKENILVGQILYTGTSETGIQIPGVGLLPPLSLFHLEKHTASILTPTSVASLTFCALLPDVVTCLFSEGLGKVTQLSPAGACPRPNKQTEEKSFRLGTREK